MKRMTRFNPPDAVGREAAEEHYVRAHHPFMRRVFRDHGDAVLRYETNVTVAQYDLAGGFGERPQAWRFVITEVDDALEQAHGFLPERFRPLIWHDHRRFLQDIDAWEVDEQVVVDRRSGQTGMVKYLLLIAAGPEPERAARRRLHDDQHVPFLRAALADAFGARLCLVNRVLREAETADDHGPGTVYAGGYRAAPKLLALEELWFDNDGWAQEFFARPDVQARLRDSALGRVEAYRVAEAIGVDRR